MLSAAISVIVATGCGGERQDKNEPSGNFTVDVTNATFPTKQRLAEMAQLVITVRNAGQTTIPDVAVTVSPGRSGGGSSDAAAFAESSDQPGLADPSRPVWVVDEGPRGGVTSYTNTWALGSLKPGAVKTFNWHVTAIKPGTHTVKYRVAAGLNGKAKAVLAGGQEPSGSFTVDVSGKPANARVDDTGHVIVTPQDSSAPAIP